MGCLPLASFSASATVSKPKWVVLSRFVGCDGESRVRIEVEKHLGVIGFRQCCREARIRERVIGLEAIATLAGIN